MTVHKYSSENEVGWNSYVARSLEGSFFHQTEWSDALVSCFNIKSHHIYSEEEGRIMGICPLYSVKDNIYGHRFMSVPIGVYGGIIAETPLIARALYEQACNIARDLKAHHIEFRNVRPDIYGPMRPSNFIPKPTHVTFLKPLPYDKNDCLSQMPRKARADVRHAIEKGLVLREIPASDGLQVCYRLYAANQRYLGSPVFSYKWFQALAAVFGDKCRIHLVFFGKYPIAGVLSFLFKDQILPFYGGALKEHRLSHPAGFMYLKLQEWAVEKGLKTFDFGRSRINSGSYQFKMHQGFVPQSLNYHFAVIDEACKQRYQARGNRTFQITSRIVKTIPLSLANMLGPLIYPKFMP